MRLTLKKVSQVLHGIGMQVHDFIGPSRPGVPVAWPCRLNPLTHEKYLKTILKKIMSDIIKQYLVFNAASETFQTGKEVGYSLIGF